MCVDQSYVPEHTHMKPCRELTEAPELREDKPYSFLHINVLTRKQPVWGTMENWMCGSKKGNNMIA